MDSRQYEYIIAIAEEQNLLNASERLFVTSSALSQGLAKIEKEIGAELFERTKSGFKPTNIGNIFIDLAYEVLRREDMTRNMIKDILNDESETYSMGVTIGRGTKIFSEIYRSFKKQYPKTKILLHDGSGKEIKSLLKKGIIDIAFMPSEMVDNNLRASVIADETLMLVVPREHYLANLWEKPQDAEYPTIELSLFSNEEFLLMNEDASMRKLTDNLFEEAGFKPKICFEASSIVAIDNLSRHGYGIALVHSSYATLDNPYAVYFNTIPHATTGLCAVYRNEKILTPSQKYLIELAKEYFISKALNKH